MRNNELFFLTPLHTAKLVGRRRKSIQFDDANGCATVPCDAETCDCVELCTVSIATIASSDRVGNKYIYKHFFFDEFAQGNSPDEQCW